MKNVFCFIKKALFSSGDIQALLPFPFASKVSRFKSTNGSGIIYDVMNWLE